MVDRVLPPLPRNVRNAERLNARIAAGEVTPSQLVSGARSGVVKRTRTLARVAPTSTIEARKLARGLEDVRKLRRAVVRELERLEVTDEKADALRRAVAEFLRVETLASGCLRAWVEQQRAEAQGRPNPGAVVSVADLWALARGESEQVREAEAVEVPTPALVSPEGSDGR